ncbi:hypothetical protein [Ferrimonas senticii]|uniref:hypothetical protein n=1 Tax=Ferrimonas senticii TaxID=394566 RepID=UPI00040D7876|nr:hypothetical protein [Ferrimonas senticii]
MTVKALAPQLTHSQAAVLQHHLPCRDFYREWLTIKPVEHRWQLVLADAVEDYRLQLDADVDAQLATLLVAGD